MVWWGERFYLPAGFYGAAEESGDLVEGGVFELFEAFGLDGGWGC